MVLSLLCGSVVSCSREPESVQGPAGERGQQGPPGPQGPAGAQGPAGSMGAAGARGESGQRGEQGPAGERGPTGLAGSDGLPGTGAIWRDANGVLIPHFFALWLHPFAEAFQSPNAQTRVGMVFLWTDGDGRIWAVDGLGRVTAGHDAIGYQFEQVAYFSSTDCSGDRLYAVEHLPPARFTRSLFSNASGTSYATIQTSARALMNVCSIEQGHMCSMIACEQRLVVPEPQLYSATFFVPAFPYEAPFSVEFP